MTEAAKDMQQSTSIGLAGLASTNTATDVASGTNRVAFGHRPKGTAKEDQEGTQSRWMRMKRRQQKRQKTL